MPTPRTDDFLLRYSRSSVISPALDKDEASRLSAKGWEPCSAVWHEESLIQILRANSMCLWAFREGERKAANAIDGSANSIMLDFDSGNPSFRDFHEWLRTQRFNYCIFTSINHQKKKGNLPPVDRFRVLIPTARDVLKVDLQRIKQYWCTKWPTCDSAIFTPDRYYFRSDCKLYAFEGGKEFWNFSELDVLTDVKITDTEDKDPSGWELSVDTLIDLGNGQQVRLREITAHTVCRCPHPNHNDQHPSAFVEVDTLGNYRVHCSSCQKMWFAEDSFVVQRGQYTVFLEDKSDSVVRIVRNPSRVEDEIKFFHNIEGWINWCRTELRVGEKDAKKLRGQLPRAGLVFDPSLPGGFIKPSPARRTYVFNTFQESEYLSRPLAQEPEEKVELFVACPTIAEILMNVFGDWELVHLYLNWHAFILQKREKPKTAWLITSDAQGVGKDLLVERVWRPIYGPHHVSVRIGSDIEKRFNASDMYTWLCVYNEIFAGGAPHTNATRRELLKFRITAPTIQIEPKGVDVFEIPNQMSYILHSNSKQAMFLDENDRRFFVVRSPEAKPITAMTWYISDSDLESRIAAELDTFALYVRRFQVNENSANRAVETGAKRDLIERTISTTSMFRRALTERDPDPFELEDVFAYEFERGEGQRIVDEISSWIRDYGAIPSTYMTKICEHHFGRGNAASGRKTLRREGIDVKTFRDEDVTRKAWCVVEVK